MKMCFLSFLGKTDNTITGVCSNNIEVRNLYFLRLHKVGSTTLWTILYRHGLARSLRMPILRSPKAVLQLEKLPSELIPSPPLNGENKYNLFGDHSIYDSDLLDTFLVKPRLHIILVRHPVEMFGSYMKFYAPYRIVSKLAKASSQKILTNLTRYEKIFPQIKNLKLTLTTQLRLDDKLDAHGRRFRRSVESRLRHFLVLSLDDLMLSLALLQHATCWPVTHFLHSKLRSQGGGKSVTVNAETTDKFCQWASHTCVIYNILMSKFQESVTSLGPVIHEEATALANMNNQLQEFCTSKSANRKRLFIAKTRWSPSLVISELDCGRFYAMPPIIRDLYYLQQNPNQCQYPTFTNSSSRTLSKKLCLNLNSTEKMWKTILQEKYKRTGVPFSR